MAVERKIEFIGSKVSPAALLASIAEREGMDAVIVVVRIDGCWGSCWSGGIDLGGMSMAALKLLYDVQSLINDDDQIETSDDASS